MAKGQKKQAYERAEKEGQFIKLFDSLKAGINRDSSISYAGLDVSTVYRWMEEVPGFKKKINDCEHYWLSIVENAKRKKIADEQYRPAIEKELKAKLPKIYGDKAEVTGEDGGPILVKRVE